MKNIIVFLIVFFALTLTSYAKPMFGVANVSKTGVVINYNNTIMHGKLILLDKGVWQDVYRIDSPVILREICVKDYDVEGQYVKKGDYKCFEYNQAKITSPKTGWNQLIFLIFYIIFFILEFNYDNKRNKRTKKRRKN